LGVISTIIGQEGRHDDLRFCCAASRIWAIERLGHQCMHRHRIGAFNDIRGPAVPSEQLIQFASGDAREHGGIGNLVAVQMEDRQDHAVGDGIEKLVRMPRRRERAGFRFSVANDTGRNEVGVIQYSTEGMAQRVAQLAALVNATGRFRRDVTRDPAGKRKLSEQLPQPGFVLRDRGVDFAVRALEICIRHEGRPAMTRAGDVDHVEVALLDDPVQVHVDEILPRCRAPMPQQPPLDVRGLKRITQERIIEQIDLADREVVRGAPVGVHLQEQVGRKR
jgi:hypothetical protein